MDARRYNDIRGLANITLKELIDWYFDEIETTHHFGNNNRRAPGNLGRPARRRGHAALYPIA